MQRQQVSFHAANDICSRAFYFFSREITFAAVQFTFPVVKLPVRPCNLPFQS